MRFSRVSNVGPQTRIILGLINDQMCVKCLIKTLGGLLAQEVEAVISGLAVHMI